MPSIELTDHEIPGIENLKVGSKHHFVVQAEHISTRKNQQYDMPLMENGTKKKAPAQPKYSGSFKITAIEHQPIKA